MEVMKNFQKFFQKKFRKLSTPNIENGTAVTILDDFDDDIVEIPQPMMDTGGLVSLIDWKSKSGYSCDICSKVLSSKNNLKAWFYSVKCSKLTVFERARTKHKPKLETCSNS